MEQLSRAEIEEARQSMREKIAAYIVEKDKENAKQFVDVIPTTPEELKQWQSDAYVGTTSVTLIDLHLRLLERDALIEVVPGVLDVPSRLVEAYLAIAYPNGTKGTNEQHKSCWEKPNIPKYCMPGTGKANGYYADIKACYWNIMRVVGWNVDYHPLARRFPNNGRPPYDWPWPEERIARNSIVSMSGWATFQVYRKKQNVVRPERRTNQRLNHELQRLIMDVTNSIAVECVEAGAVYFNVDGAICPSTGCFQRCMDIVRSWGLEARADPEKGVGPTDIVSVGRYKIGTHASGLYKLDHSSPMSYDNLARLPYAAELKKNMAWASKHAMRYYDD